MNTAPVPASPLILPPQPPHALNVHPPCLPTLSPDEIKAQILARNLLQRPLAVIFVRHGRSAGNERKNISALGEEFQPLKDQYKAMDDHNYPLVGRGMSQAIAAGRAIAALWHQGFLPGIDRGFTSPFTRAEQSFAGVIIGIRQYCQEHSLPANSVISDKGKIEIEPLLSERDWMDFATLSPQEQEVQYKKREEVPFLWTPGTAGEQMAQVVGRSRFFLNKLHRPQYAGKVLLASTHGEFMNAVELACRELHPFKDEFQQLFRAGIPNSGIYIFSCLPFAKEMHLPAESGISGFSHFMKLVPYHLPEEEAKWFPTWSETPHWQDRPSSRVTFSEFQDFPTPDSIHDLATQLAAANIGNGSVEPIF